MTIFADAMWSNDTCHHRMKCITCFIQAIITFAQYLKLQQDLMDFLTYFFQLQNILFNYNGMFTYKIDASEVVLDGEIRRIIDWVQWFREVISKFTGPDSNGLILFMRILKQKMCACNFNQNCRITNNTWTSCLYERVTLYAATCSTWSSDRDNDLRCKSQNEFRTSKIQLSCDNYSLFFFYSNKT